MLFRYTRILNSTYIHKQFVAYLSNGIKIASIEARGSQKWNTAGYPDYYYWIIRRQKDLSVDFTFFKAYRYNLKTTKVVCKPLRQN